MNLILKMEMEGLDSLDEAIDCAHEILACGLHRSAGRYGRFIRDVAWAIEADGDEVPEAFLAFT